MMDQCNNSKMYHGHQGKFRPLKKPKKISNALIEVIKKASWKNSSDDVIMTTNKPTSFAIQLNSLWLNKYQWGRTGYARKE